MSIEAASTMTHVPFDRRGVIQRAMSALHVAYDLHLGLDTSARFSISGPEGPLTATASCVRSSLRFSVHGVIAGTFAGNDLRLFDSVNQNWGFGRVYFDASSGGLNCAAALPIVGSEVDPLAVQWTVRHLADAVTAVKGYATPKFMPPTPARTTTLADVADAAASAGAVFQAVHGGEMLEQQFTEGSHSFRVQLFTAGGVILVARGRLVPSRYVDSDDVTIGTIQRVNAALGLGCVAIWPQQPQPYFQGVVPLAWVDLTPALIRNLIDETAAVMEIVDRSFPGA